MTEDGETPPDATDPAVRAARMRQTIADLARRVHEQEQLCEALLAENRRLRALLDEREGTDG